MSRIHIKLLSDDALGYMYKNSKVITEAIKKNDSNAWVYKTFPSPIFVEKKYTIEDFDLIDNSKDDIKIELQNHMTVYNTLKELPRYILADERFWLWLYLEKLYKKSKSFTKFRSDSTITDHWMFKQGKRRGIFFGILPRMFFRVELTEKDGDFSLTEWIIENPERFRNLTWRAYSSEKDLTYGIIKGEKRASDELKYDNSDIYNELAKYISYLGSAKLLDAYSSEDIEEIVYIKCKELLLKHIKQS